MTISITTTKHIYQGNGVNTVWEFSFPIIDASDIQVWLTTADNVATQVSPGLYTVRTDTKTVAFPLGSLSPLSSSETLTIMRVIPLIQETEFVNQGRIQAESVEDSLDRLTMIAQQQQEELSRSIQVNVDNEVITDVDSLLNVFASHIAQSQNYVNMVTQLLAEAQEFANQISSTMPSGWNRIRIEPATMEMFMSYLGETTNDEIFISNGELILRLNGDDESVGVVAMVWRGTWVNTTAYPYLSLVRASGSTYLCISPTGAPAGTVTTNTAYWAVIGASGSAATVAVGTVTTLAAGTAATVVNAGTTSAAVLNFGIPRGATGATGAAGTAGINGETPTVNIASVNTLLPTETAYVTNTGTSTALNLVIGIPQGETGARGTGLQLGRAFATVAALTAAYPMGATTAHVVEDDGDVYVWDEPLFSWVSAGSLQGAPGNDGTAASITVGSTTTLPAGNNAAVTNVGSPSAAVFDFAIPRGATGASGTTGATGAAATIAAGTVTSLAPGSTPTVTNAGTTSAAIFNFGLPSNAFAPYEGTQDLGTITSTTTLDASAGNIKMMTIGGNLALNLTAATGTGFSRVLTLVITNGGNYTVTWGTTVLWGGGSAPVLTASGTDILNLFTPNGGVTWYGMVAGLTFA